MKSTMNRATFAYESWPSGMVQLLDDHHLVVLSDEEEIRHRYATTMADHLRSLPETRLVAIDGRKTFDLDSFIQHVFQRAKPKKIDVESLESSIDSLIAIMCEAPEDVKRRYFIWYEAENMLETDVSLFSSIANAMLYVAAAHEHLMPEPLVIDRILFVGGEKLGAYAEDTNSDFSRWGGPPDSRMRDIPNIIKHPPVLTYRIDT